MIPISEIEAPISLDELAARICSLSNFRFNWQWFRLDSNYSSSVQDAWRILSTLIIDTQCHQFLFDNFVPEYNDDFEIAPIHEHSILVNSEGDFENVVASAAADKLGAYSRYLSNATTMECAEIRHLFGEIGSYVSYELQPGNVPDCEKCAERNSHLFTTWFYGVAWDWCFVLIWKDINLAWVGCLTDTD